MRSYIINLDRHPDRWERIAALAALTGWRAERLPAVDAVSYAGDLQAFVPPDPCYELSDAEIACTLSHQRAWERLLNSGEPRCAVFEDDIEIDERLPACLGAGEWMPPDAHVVKLETYVQNTFLSVPVRELDSSRALCRLGSVHYGSAGYVVSREGASRLLEISRKIDRTTDDFLFDARTLHVRKLRVYQMVPAPCVQVSRLRGDRAPEFLRSSIMPARWSRERFSFRRKLQREIARPFRQLGRGAFLYLPLLIAGYRRASVPYSGALPASTLDRFPNPRAESRR